MDIKIDEGALRDVVQKAILDQIGQEGRDQLVAAAITFLLQKPNSSYGPRESPLQLAFNAAVSQAAHTIVREMVQEDPELQVKLRAAVGEAIAKMEEKNFTDNLGSALAMALRRDD